MRQLMEKPNNIQDSLRGKALEQNDLSDAEWLFLPASCMDNITRPFCILINVTISKLAVTQILKAFICIGAFDFIRDGNYLDMLFNFYTGILLTSTGYFTIYCLIMKNNPKVYPKSILPGLISGLPMIF